MKASGDMIEPGVGMGSLLLKVHGRWEACFFRLTGTTENGIMIMKI
jgi:hypothetical protein